MKYIIYLRKSTDRDDKQVASLETQYNECSEIVEKKNLEVLKIYKESQSAKRPGRPLFNEMVKKIENDEAQGIICWNVNRLSRNSVDGGRVQWLMDEFNINIITPMETYNKENSSLLFKISMGMAEQYSKDLSKMVKDGNKTHFESGFILGMAPPGYINKRNENERGYADIDEVRFPLVRKMWDLLLTGNYTPQEIKKIANDKWGYKIADTTIYRLFRNPFYYGLMVRNMSGELRKKYGNHKPMITEEEYYRAQIILGEQFKKKQPLDLSLGLNGSLIKCGCCGGSITTETHTKKYKNGTTQKFTYARCTKRKVIIGKSCVQKYVPIEKLNEEVEKILSKITISPKFVEWALKYLREENKTEEVDRENIKKSLIYNLGVVDRKKNRLLETYLEDAGILTKEDYLNRKSELEREQKEIKAKIDSIENRTDTWFELAEKTFDFAKNCLYWYQRGDAKTRHTILQTIGGSNLVLNDGKLDFIPVKPFYFIYKNAPILEAHQYGGPGGDRTHDAHLKRVTLYH